MNPTEHLESVIGACEAALADSLGVYGDIPAAKNLEVRTRLISAVERVAPVESIYRRHLDEVVLAETSWAWQLEQLVGLARALLADVRGGYLDVVVRLIRGEVFGDFLDMARHLLDSGYKDAAAVIGGSVLEDQLRHLAQEADIPIEAESGRPKKASQLNAELKKADVYRLLESKNITAWLDLRNKAAHGQYDEYSAEQVSLLLLGVTDFLARTERRIV